MTEIVDTEAEARALPVPALVVRENLAAWMDAVKLGHGELHVKLIGEGKSNATFLLQRGDASFVLRRPPRPPHHPSAHDVLREARILAALSETAVPVPRVLAVCDDLRILDAPFYVMEALDGEVVTVSAPPRTWAPGAQARMANHLVEALIEIHAVEWERTTLAFLARRGHHLDRQLRRLDDLWARHRIEPIFDVELAGRLLRERMPTPVRPALVHGDFRLANVMWNSSSPLRLQAVLDWELAATGDPLVDLGLLVESWTEPGDDHDVYAILGPIPPVAGLSTRAELIEHYRLRTGRGTEELSWYRSFALWKTAVIIQGNLTRQATTAPHEGDREAMMVNVRALGRRALATIRENEDRT